MKEYEVSSADKIYAPHRQNGLTGETLRILHVTECFSGGVGTAIQQIADLTRSTCTNYLLYSTDEADPVPEMMFRNVFPLRSNGLLRARQTMKLAESLNINVIHAHSSWAGLYSRLLSGVTPVVYQPHCYVIEDTTKPRMARVVFRRVEAILARRCVTLVLSAREQSVAQSIGPSELIVRTTNAPRLYRPVAQTSTFPPGGSTVAMVGRICDQKDPKYFADVARRVRATNSAVKFVWMGDGDQNGINILRKSGVEVTGWLDPHALLSRMSRTAIYFHSAAYEGFPLTVLDAANLSLPVIVRAIPAFDDTALITVNDPAEAAAVILGLLENSYLRDDAQRRTRRVLEGTSASSRLSSITRAYKLAVSSAQVRESTNVRTAHRKQTHATRP